MEFVSYWGWTQFDYFTLTEPNYPTLSATSDLADKNATPETQSLMNYLASVYGEHIISGQQEFISMARMISTMNSTTSRIPLASCRQSVALTS